MVNKFTFQCIVTLLLSSFLSACASLPAGMPAQVTETPRVILATPTERVILATPTERVILSTSTEQVIPATPTETKKPTQAGTADPLRPVVLDYYMNGGPPFIPFAMTGSAEDSAVFSAIYAELARRDGKGDFIPYLAQSLPDLQNGQARFTGSGVDEQFVVEFHLRPNLTWQDGALLTADDLAFSWKLVMDPAWPGTHFNLNGYAPEIYVDSVEAAAPDLVIFRFMSQRQARRAVQNGGLLKDLELYTSLSGQIGPVVPLDFLDVGRNVFPQHLLQGISPSEIGNSEFARHPIYAGAYRLAEGGENGQPVMLEAFDAFALGKPAIQRVVIGAAYSFSSAMVPLWQPVDLLREAMKASGIQAQLDFPGVNARAGEDPRAYDALSQDGLASVIWEPTGSWETLDFNLDNPHLSDLKVRQAIAHAIDRKAIIEQVLDGHASLMRSYLPAWHPLYAGDTVLPDYDFDPEKARALLQEAGYNLSQNPAVHPTRGPLKLTLASMDVNLYPRTQITDLIQQQLKAIGVQLEVKFYEWKEFEGQDCTAIRNGRKFDLGLAAWVGINRFPVNFVEQVTTIDSIPTPENGCPYRKSNWPGWREPDADALLPQLKDGRLALEHLDQYQQSWAEHQTLWASELPSLPLFNPQRPVVVSNDLHGIQPNLYITSGIDDAWNIFQWTWK
jgi:peptide/nickel transport system substrate-binding protein